MYGQYTNFQATPTNIPSLSFFICLHAQLSLEFVDRTIIDTAIRCEVNHSTPPLVAVCKGEAHLDVPRSRSTSMHESRPFGSIFNEYCLLNRLVDDELVSNKMILNLEIM